jgi:hypothetical protein
VADVPTTSIKIEGSSSNEYKVNIAAELKDKDGSETFA